MADINECDKNVCNQHDIENIGVTCINTNGSYLCQCIEGFTKNGNNCSGIIIIVTTTCMKIQYRFILCYQSKPKG